MSKPDKTNTVLRALPSVDSLLKTDAAVGLSREVGAARLSSFARQVTRELRAELRASPAQVLGPGNGVESLRTELLRKAQRRLIELHQNEKASGLRKAINATGVILHTNLGRAPLSDAARRAIDEVV